MNSTAMFSAEKIAEADFPSEFGSFRIYGFRGPGGEGREASPATGEESVELKMGDIHAAPPLVSIHSH
jgi:hypothetical protein